MSACRKSVGVERTKPVECESAHSRVASGVEPFARRKIFDDGRLGLSRFDHEARKSCRESKPGPERPDNFRRAQLLIGEGLEEGFEETDL